jgi:hypothetical protein
MSSNSNRLDEHDADCYDPATGTQHHRHDWQDSDSVCLAVVETVSTVTGRDPNSMDPLYSVLDADALDALLSSAGDGTVNISFTFEGCSVTVASDGTVDVGLESER